mgnify:CR=1 FL=1
MRFLQNEKGVALVTSIMFTALSLVICMSLLYIITSGIQATGTLKRYRTALEATYGGTELMLKDIINASFGYPDYLNTHPSAAFVDYLPTRLGVLASNATVSGCMYERMTLPSTQWSSACANSTLSPKDAPDISFELNATSGSPYVVYSKIVNTMERKFSVFEGGVAKTVVIAGNSDTSTFSLEGASTTEGGQVTVPHYPYVYRVEIQGERKQNPLEKANVSAVYAY